jgi:diadenosine tetraphosphate (Ap4A) HIT family hydrolase
VNACFVCEKHANLHAAVPGGAIAADEHVVVSHLPLTTPAGSEPDAYLGYLFVEPRRHVAELGDLDAAEAASLGRLASRASGALTAHGAEHVYAAVIGHGVDHLHVHLIPRYPGAPREYWWTRVDEWPAAPRGGAIEIAALAERLRGLLPG